MSRSTLREQLQTALGTAYSIERELGGGGMSRVFVADESALGRRVVVKVLSPELAAGVSAERFAREVKVAARLQQANIVPLLAAGDAGGCPFFTMPFVEGLSLRDRMRSGGPLPLGEAVHVLRDIAKALAYAHERGIVHRDIKPENVLLSGGTAMVTDFGIAKALTTARETGDARDTESTSIGLPASHTTVGISLGTPAYMAPEQAAADPTSDHRVDIYALGVVAYELLTGRHPFADRTTPSALLAAHMAETPVTVTSARQEIPASLGALVMQCLEKDPVRRPRSALEVLHALDTIVTPTPSGARLAEVSHGRRWRLPLAAAGVILALSVVGIAAWRSRSGGSDATSLQSLAVLPFANVGGDTSNAYFAEGMADELTTALAKVPNLRVAARSSAFSFQGKQIPAREVAKALNVGAVLEGAIRRSGDKLRVNAQLTSASDGLVLWSDSYEREAKDVFAVQDDISRAIVSALRVTLGSDGAPSAVRGTTNLEAYDLFLRGTYLLDRRGSENVQSAIDHFRRAVAKDSNFARAHAGLSRALVTIPYYSTTDMATVLGPATSAAERAVALDPRSADAHVALGNAYFNTLRWADAESELRRAIALDSTQSSAHFLLGRVLLFTGRIASAHPFLVRARELEPLSAVMGASLAYSHTLAGRHAEAVTEARRSFELDSTLFPAVQFLALAHLAAGNAREARQLASGIHRGTGDINMRGSLCYVLGRVGDRAEGEQCVRELEARPVNEWRRNTALVRAYLGRGDTVRALEHLERASSSVSGEMLPISVSLSDQMYDALRASPRFRAVVRQWGLDEALLTSPTGGRPK